MTQTKKRRTKYRTTNWKAYNQALKARGALTMWLDKDMQWLAKPSGKRGRRLTFSGRADPARARNLATKRFVHAGGWTEASRRH